MSCEAVLGPAPPGYNSPVPAPLPKRQKLSELEDKPPIYGDAATQPAAAQQQQEQKQKQNTFFGRIMARESFKITFLFTKVYLIIFCAFIGILSIYWGSLFNRTAYLKNLHYLVVIGEQQEGLLPPLIGDVLALMLRTPQAGEAGTFDIIDSAEFTSVAVSNGRNLFEEAQHQVFVQKYWGAFFIPENATLDYLTALQTANSSFSNTPLVTFIYETGRNLEAVPGFVINVAEQLENEFALLCAEAVNLPLLALLDDEQRLALSRNASNILTPFWFHYSDMSETIKPILIGPIQIGFIYLLVMSFHQFNFASTTHAFLGKKLNLRPYMIYHYLVTQSSYLVMSLVYCLLTLAFQISPNKTFGNPGGFFVQWSIVFLSMSALGGPMENAAIQIFMRKKMFIGFWIVFWLVVNLCPVMSPIPLMNRFYRWGYAMPMLNAYDLSKVVFFNTWRGTMGRNFGVLIAWIVASNVILPFNIRWAKNYVERKKHKAD